MILFTLYIIPVILFISYLWILQYFLYYTCDFYHYIYNVLGHSKSVEVVVFSPDGQYLASGSWDRTAILWDREVGHKGRDIHNCTMFWNFNLYLSEFRLISIFIFHNFDYFTDITFRISVIIYQSKKNCVIEIMNVSLSLSLSLACIRGGKCNDRVN